MAVPTSYTFDEFADYLKNEVLRDSAEGIGFEDIVPEIPEIRVRITIRASGTPPYNFTTGIPIEPPGFTIPVGTSLTWSNGATRTLDATIDPDDTTMNITGLGAAFQPGDYSSRLIRNAIARVRNPIYESITEEALLAMGLASIASVNSTNIEIFRAYGRVELLRKAMQNVAAKYGYTMPVGGPQGIQNVYTQVARMFQREQARLNSLLVIETPPTGLIPDEVQSAGLETEAKF